MSIFIPIVSIFVLTSVAWFANKIFPIRICPVCAGVALTWIWMLTTFFLGYGIDLLILGMLMGGSVVGIAYQLERHFLVGRVLQNKLLLWKTVFIVSGFMAVYSLINVKWIAFLLATAIIAALSIFAITKRSGSEMRKQNKNVEQLEKDMEDCCS